MINIEHFKQRTKLTCGPTCLRMILDYYGIRKREKELAKLCKTDENGTEVENLVSVARKFGFKTYIKDFAELKDLEKYVDKKIPVIVNWFSNIDGHYSIVVSVTKKEVKLVDPETGRIKTFDVRTFQRIWFTFDGDFIKAKKDMVIRRMIVLRKSKK